MWCADARNTYSPTSRLPPEVLAYVFEWLILVSPADVEGRLGWIESVTHVCRSWREVALGRPALWRRISFTIGLEWAKEMLARAKSAPLVI
ncbi:hypothetical protein FA95DRAFT_1639067, partial [Auriscalpium vulgare]